MSMTTLSKIVDAYIFNEKNCDETENDVDDDQQLLQCMKTIDIRQIDGIDNQQRKLFFQQYPGMWIQKRGYECCGDRLIVFENTWFEKLYYFEYLIYKVHVYGRHRLPESLPKKKKLAEIMPLIR